MQIIQPRIYIYIIEHDDTGFVCEQMNDRKKNGISNERKKQWHVWNFNLNSPQKHTHTLSVFIDIICCHHQHHLLDLSELGHNIFLSQ